MNTFTHSMAQHIAAGKYDSIQGFNGVPDTRVMMEKPVKFDISNVANYLYMHPQDYWSWAKDFPSYAPPFDSCWFEFVVPKTTAVKGKVIEDHPMSIGRRGVLLTVIPQEFMWQFQVATDESDARAYFAPLAKQARWVIRLDTYECTRFRGKVQGPFVTLWIAVGEDGRMLGDRPITGWYVPHDEEIVKQVGLAWAYPVAMALSFLACSNVKQVEEADTRPRQQRRADERSGIPYIKFKTLRIGAISESANDAAMSGDGRTMPLHIVRGHFATYTAEKPLFGKYVGTFWVPAHTRGSAKVGVVGKDYQLVGGAS